MTLKLENVSKTVGVETHIDNVTLECVPGSFNVLLGLTLSGKTTLMRLMAGLDQPTRGRVLVDGRDVTGVPVRKRNVGMVYQQFINYPSLSCYDNIASPLKLARLPKPEIDRRVRAEAERLHIDHLLDRMPAELSGGQQQRMAMARALVRDTDLLLLDEPLVNLDYKLREELRAEMRDIFAERDAIVVYATTDPMEALTLGGQTAVLHEGRLVQFGSTAHVYHHPANVHVSQVFSDPPMNLIPAQLDNGELTLGDGTRFPAPAHLRGLAAGEYRIGLRPPHLNVTAPTDNAIPLDGVVEVAEISGSETYIHMRRDQHEWVVQQEGVHSFHMNDPIRVYADPRHLFVFRGDGKLAAAPQRAGTGEASASLENTHGTH
jgi:glycerol transport system ATP-binding protein